MRFFLISIIVLEKRTGGAMAKLSHINKRGEAVMVDISGKPDTAREAVAEGIILMNRDTLKIVLAEGVEKGDVFGVARIAGIMGAKKTPELIPLCHPVSVNSVQVDFKPDEKKGEIRVTCHAKVEGTTGVEMEAMTGAAIACLTVYDMCKGLDKSIEIKQIRLIKKSGGKSGTFINTKMSRKS
jgi:cyclic pyranopterin phosphate synthase